MHSRPWRKAGRREKEKVMAKAKKKGLAIDYTEPKHLFAGENGKSLTSVRKALQTTCKKAVIVKHVHPHMFRHS